MHRLGSIAVAAAILLETLVPSARQAAPTVRVTLGEKNKAAWDAALAAGGNRDYTLTILPGANHSQWEAKVGRNAEMKSLQRFVPGYFVDGSELVE